MRNLSAVSLVTLLAAAAAAACSASSSGGATPPPPGGDDAGGDVQQPPNDPVSTFYADFHASRYTHAAGDATALDTLLQSQPMAADPSIVRGLSHLWHLAEAGRDPMPNPQALMTEGESLMPDFQQAKQNNPQDPRVDCWLGIVMTRAGLTINNPQLVQQGQQMLDQGAQAYPEFNLFCVALGNQDYPYNDPNFTKGVDALWQTMDVCFANGGQVDRTNPDIKPYLSQETSTGPKRACWDDPIAPHSFEGFALYTGDLLVKQGNVAVAKVFYNDAKEVPDYASWPYKSLIDDRLSSDLEARAALYHDTDPKNDPKFGGDSIAHGCAYCHATTADEP